MKGLRIIRCMFPELDNNPCFGIDYEIEVSARGAEELVLLGSETLVLRQSLVGWIGWFGEVTYEMRDHHE